MSAAASPAIWLVRWGRRRGGARRPWPSSPRRQREPAAPWVPGAYTSSAPRCSLGPLTSPQLVGAARCTPRRRMCRWIYTWRSGSAGRCWNQWAKTNCFFLHVETYLLTRWHGGAGFLVVDGGAGVVRDVSCRGRRRPRRHLRDRRRRSRLWKGWRRNVSCRRPPRP